MEAGQLFRSEAILRHGGYVRPNGFRAARTEQDGAAGIRLDGGAEHQRCQHRRIRTIDPDLAGPGSGYFGALFQVPAQCRIAARQRSMSDDRSRRCVQFPREFGQNAMAKLYDRRKRRGLPANL